MYASQKAVVFFFSQNFLVEYYLFLFEMVQIWQSFVSQSCARQLRESVVWEINDQRTMFNEKMIWLAVDKISSEMTIYKHVY